MAKKGIEAGLSPAQTEKLVSYIRGEVDIPKDVRELKVSVSLLEAELEAQASERGFVSERMMRKLMKLKDELRDAVMRWINE